MKNNRREFLKLSSFLGAGVITGVLNPANGSTASKNPLEKWRVSPGDFNMCGYAAPKLETVRVGFVGLGNRGPHAVERMTYIDGVEIKGLCDIRPEKANAV